MAKTYTKPKLKQIPETNEDNDSEIQFFGLDQLHLDTTNPRFAGRAGVLKNEAAVLDKIVNSFGIEDVISSIAVNGYFDAEPLVGQRDRKSSDIRILEGNRRLAACLILANDPRAKNQRERVKKYQRLQKQSGMKPVSEVPVKVYSTGAVGNLLSYLGVRHLVGSQPWDAYAKAAWIAQVLEQKELELDAVVSMIGDTHRTARRLLEGYYFVNQLIASSLFDPDDSLRRGRGSNPEYPFSWVYTGLGYSQVRKWLGMSDLSEPIRKSPIAKNKLDEAASFLTMLFGNRSKEIPCAIIDSRQIGDLAVSIGDSKRRLLLKRGKNINEVMRLNKPADVRVLSGLQDAEEALAGVLVALGEGELEPDEAFELLKTSKKVSAMAISAKNAIREIVNDTSEGDESDD